MHFAGLNSSQNHVFWIFSKSIKAAHQEKDQFKWFWLDGFTSYLRGDIDDYPLRSFFRQDLLNSSEFESVVKLLQEQIKTTKAA